MIVSGKYFSYISIRTYFFFILLVLIRNSPQHMISWRIQTKNITIFLVVKIAFTAGINTALNVCSDVLVSYTMFGFNKFMFTLLLFALV